MQLVSDSTQIAVAGVQRDKKSFPHHHRTTDTSSLDCWDKAGWFRKDSCWRGEVTTICSLGQKFRITRSGCVLSSICTVSMSLCFLWPQISIVCQQELRSSSACSAHLSPGFSSAQMKSFPLIFSSTKHSFQQNCPLYNPTLALQTVVHFGSDQPVFYQQPWENRWDLPPLRCLMWTLTPDLHLHFMHYTVAS